jgi:hypothetical protein
MPVVHATVAGLQDGEQVAGAGRADPVMQAQQPVPSDLIDWVVE